MRSLLLIFFVLLYLFPAISQPFDPAKMNEILYGVSYYYEYMPYERLEKDVQMMKDCGINVVRIGESTWSTDEPQEGIFDFSKLDKVLDAMYKDGIKVIVGTPTYAVPQWMAKKYPDIMVTTMLEKQTYGGRQNFDITNPTYLFFAERIVRKMISHIKDHPAVIGYQVDNETKSYQTASDNVKRSFLEYLKRKFKTPENLNKQWNLAYWSHSISDWDDFNITPGWANQAYWLEWNRFQRQIATDFLQWEANIVNEYKKPEQFITQNFDLYWRNDQSSGPNPDVEHFQAAKIFDVAGIDIYHDVQDLLDGMCISFGGDYTRSFKRTNYLVLETQAESRGWSATQYPPYDGQLRQCFYSHLACGANMVSYWPWHSIHNSNEAFWKGILSHDMEPGRLYYEVKQTAAEAKDAGSHLVNLKKNNKVAILYSIDAFNALNLRPFSKKINYADIILQMYNSLYRQNVGVDFIIPESNLFSKYNIIVIPPLYIVTDDVLKQINEYVKNGGHLIMSFRSGFCDENSNIRPIMMPGLLRKACGFYYQEFSNFNTLSLKDNPFHVAPDDNKVSEWMEFLIPEKAKVLAYYDHPSWSKYAAITQNQYGKGTVTYIGTVLSGTLMEKVIYNVLEKANLLNDDQKLYFPLIIKHGTNQYGKTIHYIFNYSGDVKSFDYSYGTGTDLLNHISIKSQSTVQLKAWDVLIVEEN